MNRFTHISLKLILLWFILLHTIQAFAEDPIVYSRCARITTPLDVTAEVSINGVTQQVTRTFRGLDVQDKLPDVTNFFSNFTAPCDLMYFDPNLPKTQTNPKILYDCSSTSTDANACAALDASVSFDGQNVAFSLFKGSLFRTTVFNLHPQVMDANADPNTSTKILIPDPLPFGRGFANELFLPSKQISTTGAHLNIVNLGSGAVTVVTPFNAGTWDSGPAFLSSTRLAFTSNRDGHTITQVWQVGATEKGNRLWNIDIDGNNLDLASHHTLGKDQHPFLLKDGRLAYSSWQVGMGQAFRSGNGSPGFFTTLDNLFHIYTQSPDGAVNFPLYGQHSGFLLNSNFQTQSGVSAGKEDHDAAHFITQTADERVWFADYYRGNNSGLGVVIGVLPEPTGREGDKSPSQAGGTADLFLATDVINFAPWATNADDVSKLIASGLSHPNYADPMPYLGKVGHPAALSGVAGEDLMVAWGKGPCNTVLGSSSVFPALGLPTPPLTDGGGSGVGINVLTSLNLDIPGCDVGLYRSTQIPSQSPTDLVEVIDTAEWHEIMGRAAVPYSQIYGISQPTKIQRADLLVADDQGQLDVGTPFGLLGAASMTDRETHPHGGIKFVGEKQFHLQGTDTINYDDTDICGMRILSILPNRNTRTWQDIANIAGERVSILGEVLVRNPDGTARAADPSGNADTSFLLRMPANSPYMMQSIDCKGRTLNTDQTWQSLRPGEKKVCGGCHVHSKPSRIEFEESLAASSNFTIPHLGEGKVPLINMDTNGNLSTRNAVPTGTAQGTDVYGLQIVYDRDIQPIFDQHCVSCHGGSSPDAGLALDQLGLNRSHFQENITPTTWWCLVADKHQTCVLSSLKTPTTNGFSFRRPQLTRYMRAFNSLGSLLYWKASNIRTDNFQDSDRSNDIDFGVDHPHTPTITTNELGLISRWIDIGSAGGPLELLDTQKPTIHLAGIVNASGNITELRVGTVDIGTGVNTSSLVVCLLASDGSCTNIANNGAQPHGITAIPISTLSGVSNQVIVASIEDIEGNKTEVQRTASWLANAPSSNIVISPIANETILEDSSVSISISFTDANSTANTISVSSNTGALSTVSNNSFTVTPDTNFNGDIFVAVTVTDTNNLEDSTSTSFTVTVTPVNDAPVVMIVSQAGDLQTGEADVTLDASNSSDIENDSLSFNWSQISGTNITITNADSSLATIAATDQVTGSASFEVTVNDGSTNAKATININFVSSVTQEAQSSGGGSMMWLLYLVLLPFSLKRAIKFE